MEQEKKTADIFTARQRLEHDTEKFVASAAEYLQSAHEATSYVAKRWPLTSLMAAFGTGTFLGTRYGTLLQLRLMRLGMTSVMNLLLANYLAESAPQPQSQTYIGEEHEH